MLGGLKALQHSTLLSLYVNDLCFVIFHNPGPFCQAILKCCNSVPEGYKILICSDVTVKDGIQASSICDLGALASRFSGEDRYVSRSSPNTMEVLVGSHVATSTKSYFQTPRFSRRPSNIRHVTVQNALLG